MSHRAFGELASGAALDDLEPIEAAELSDHLASCEPCRRDAGELADVAALVALAAPARRTPASLRLAVLAAIAREDARTAGGAVASPGPSIVFRKS